MRGTEQNVEIRNNAVKDRPSVASLVSGHWRDINTEIDHLQCFVLRYERQKSDT